MEQLSLLGDNTKENEEYRAFVDKFKPKKTTDDCYTPPNIYEAVKTWAVNEYHISEDTPIIRPFYPGGDYERYAYPEGCVVIDNPPFSILSKIVRFYENRNIKYFLFAPTMTLFTTAAGIARYLVCKSDVTYENGAKVNTSFVTNMDECKVRIAPDLIEAIDAAEKENLKKEKNNFRNTFFLTMSLRRLYWEKSQPEKSLFLYIQTNANLSESWILWGRGYTEEDFCCLIEQRQKEQRQKEQQRSNMNCPNASSQW